MGSVGRTVPAVAGRAGDLVGALTSWLAESRVDDAAAARTREHWLRQQLDAEATVGGVLLDLAERGDGVVVLGADRRRRRVAVRAVATDFCALRSADGADLLLPYRAIAAIETAIETPGPASRGGRPPSLDLTFADALAALAADRSRVLLVAADGSPVAGEVRGVGRDVVVLRRDGGAGTAYLPVGSVLQVAVEP